MNPAEAYHLGQQKAVPETLPPGLGRHWARGFFEACGRITPKGENVQVEIAYSGEGLDFFHNLLSSELHINRKNNKGEIIIRQKTEYMVALIWMYRDADDSPFKKQVEKLHSQDQYIYLAGPMLPATSDPYYIEWRAKATRTLKKHGMVGLDPYHGEGDANMDPKGVSGSLPPATVFQKDYWMVCTAHKILSNLTINGYHGSFPRAVIGTFFEMGIAWEKNIPIYTIVESGNDCFRRHPFILSTSQIIVSSVGDAIKYLVNEKA